MVAAIPGGRRVAGLFRQTGEMFTLGIEALVQAARSIFVTRDFPLTELVEQCWFLAKVTTLPVILISIPFGAVIALQIGSLLAQLGAQSQTGAVMVLAVVREQAPVATALLIAGAGGSAMCADLGARRIRDEIAAMEVMAVNPVARLVAPRLLASTMVAFLLDAVVSVAGLAGGWFFATQVNHVPSSDFFASFSALAQLPDLLISLAKAVVFGLLVGMVACYKGLTCKAGPKGVGDAVRQAVVISFVLLFFVNFVMTAFYFNFVPQRL